MWTYFLWSKTKKKCNSLQTHETIVMQNFSSVSFKESYVSKIMNFTTTTKKKIFLFFKTKLHIYIVIEQKRKKSAHRKTNNFNFTKIYLFSKLWCFCNDDNRVWFGGFFVVVVVIFFSLCFFVMNTIYVLIMYFTFHVRT